MSHPKITMSADAFTQMSNDLNQMGRQYREQVIINKQLKQEIKTLKEVYKVEIELYEEEDDWIKAAGYKQTDTEYEFHISDFQSWVIKKNCDNELEYYIRWEGVFSCDKLQEDKKLVGCPDGNYVSWQDLEYELREGENDFEDLEDELETLEDFEEEDDGGHPQVEVSHLTGMPC
jgi:tRNA G10  N-methylase Trm11